VFERCGVGDMQDLLGAANIKPKIQIVEAMDVAKATLPSLNECTFADILKPFLTDCNVTYP